MFQFRLEHGSLVNDLLYSFSIADCIPTNFLNLT